MALRVRNFPSGVDADLQQTNTSPANSLLAASATLTRYARGLKVTNSTTGTLQWSFGIGAAAVLTAVNATYFQKDILAKDTFTHYWSGKGRRFDNQVVMGFASAVGVKFELQYDESDALDA